MLDEKPETREKIPEIEGIIQDAIFHKKISVAESKSIDFSNEFLVWNTLADDCFIDAEKCI